MHLFPRDLRFEHGGAKLVSCPKHHLTLLRPCTSRLSGQNGKICLQKYLPISGELSITSYLKQNALDYWRHLTIENNLKVEKRYIISKTSTHPQKNTFGVRVKTNIPKNSKAMIMLAPYSGWCLLHHKGIKNDQTIFFHVTAGNVKFAVRQWPNFHTFNLLYETRLYRGNAILEILYSRLKKLLETAE